MIPQNLKNFALFIDGRGYAGKAPEVSLPKLTRKTREYNAGGMAGPVELDMGLEKLELNFTLEEFNQDVLKLWGVSNLQQVALRLTGTVNDDSSDEHKPVEVVVRGRWKEVDFGSWKKGDAASMKVMVNAAYYRLSVDSEELIEIDMINMIEKVGGIDRLESQRANLGI
jgi:P2 family phage contractile tail tube protein